MPVFENHFESGSICNQIQGDQINHYNIEHAHFDHQRADAAEAAKSHLAPKKKQGKSPSALFQQDGNRTVEDMPRRQREQERLCAYLHAHHLGNHLLTSQSDDRLNEVIVCFCHVWRQRKWVSPEVGAPALRRFLTEDCGIGLSVSERSFEGVIRTMIDAPYNASFLGEVKACFE